jgi:hypothetical protein
VNPSATNIPNTPNPDQEGHAVQCTSTPTSAVWAAGDIHLFGSPIIPSTVYDVCTCNASGGECACAQFETALWGDVTSPFFPGSPNEPSFADISACVDKFKNLASAPNQVFTDLGGAGTEAVDRTTNFADIGADVDAFKNIPYPYAITACSP